MAIKNIIVCGDSYATPDRNCPGKHFSEILNNEYAIQGHPSSLVVSIPYIVKVL
jgi:hypothetical protein